MNGFARRKPEFARDRLPVDVDRRRFIQALSAGGALLAAGSPALSEGPGHGAARGPNPGFRPDLDIELAADTDELAVLPGRPTLSWKYRGKVIKGDAGAFQTLPGSAFPVIRARSGQRIRIRFLNRISQDSIIHWHGLHLPHDMDGHPRYAIRTGEQFVYEFTVSNRAGTYWFHPHPHGRTGEQVYFGLAGLFIVSDDEEAAAQLPQGEFDLAWIIQDRRFDSGNQLIYLQNMMERMTGLLGNRVLVNGQADFVQPVATAAYRVRLLNASNARIYKLARDDGRPLTVIGTDGGLLERPLPRRYVTLAPAERVELWLDFTDRSVGDRITINSLPFNAGGGPMGGAGGSDAFPVLTVRVDRKITTSQALAARLSGIRRYRVEDAVNRDAPRIFRAEMGMGRATINGRSFEMTGATRGETVRLGDLEVWEFTNPAGMMTMAHPMHVHNLQFQVLDRKIDPRFAQFRGSLDAGFLDEGWKDVVLVMPGERVRLLMRFTDYAGLYLFHCHILEHGDLGMMRNYRVEPA